MDNSRSNQVKEPSLIFDGWGQDRTSRIDQAGVETEAIGPVRGCKIEKYQADKQNLKDQCTQLEERVNLLEEKMAGYTPPEDILSQFTLDLKYGFHRDNTALRIPHCSKCLLENKKVSPLQTEGEKWRCLECGQYYSQERK